MWPLNPRALICSFFVVIISIFAVTGCSDDPENEAAKKLRQQTEKALDIAETGDFEKAQKELKNAIRQASVSGPAAEPAILASGNIAMDHAKTIQSKLVKAAEPVSSVVDNISVITHQISRLQIEQEKVDGLLSGSDEQIAQLDDLIAGDSEKPGIEEQLTDAYRQLRQLQEQKEQLYQQQQRAQSIADDLQAQADVKLRQVDAAKDDEKPDLQRTGYDLLISRKEHLKEVQEKADWITDIDGQIAIIEPFTERLQADLTSVEQNIDDIENSPQRNALKSQLRNVRKEIEDAEGDITSMAAALKNTQEEYNKIIEETDSLLDGALKDYKKIRSQSTRDIASLRLADCYSVKASIAADCMNFHEHLSKRLRSISNGVEGRSGDTLNRIAIKCSGLGSDYSKKAMEHFDLGIEAYSKLHKRLARGKDEFACDVTKNFVLALYGKITLAEKLDEYDIVDETLAQAEELMEKAETCDPDFSNSITARLFSGDIEFTPEMAVDSATFYTQLKSQFQGWKKMKGDEREKEVKRLLEMLEQMGKPRDREDFNNIIGPEKKQLEAVLAGGFIDEVSDFDASSSDPNYY